MSMAYNQQTNGLTDSAKFIKTINYFHKNAFLSIESKMRI